MSKSAVSGRVARLKERFAKRRGREMKQETYVIVFLDAFTCRCVWRGGCKTSPLRLRVGLFVIRPAEIVGSVNK